MPDLIEVIDVLILVWLIGTWFYEGHHRRCTVISKCPACGEEHDLHCASADKDLCDPFAVMLKKLMDSKCKVEFSSGRDKYNILVRQARDTGEIEVADEWVLKSAHRPEALLTACVKHVTNNLRTGKPND